MTELSVDLGDRSSPVPVGAGARHRLLELLPGFRVPPMEIHAITPQREIPEKVRRVITALRSHFAEPSGAVPTRP